MDEIVLTDEQRTVIDAVIHSVQRTGSSPPEHIILEAVAGSGKSSTLVALVDRLRSVRPDARILILQFNQDACARMRRRLDGGADVHTIHAFALRLIGTERHVDPRKVYHAWTRMRPARVAEGGARALAEWFRVQRFVDDARHRAWFPDFNAGRPLSLEMAVLEATLLDREVLDQEDAVYHALCYGFVAPEYDAILVDEAQDLNRANLLFVRRCLTRRTVLCAVGDPAQSIYAFRGAMPDSMQRLKEAFGARVLRLTGCFRCPRRVVEIASYLNPHIHAAPNATAGRVALSTTLAPWAHVLARSGSGGVLFLARCNRALLDFFTYLYEHRDALPDGGLRWISPFLAAHVEHLRSPEAATLRELHARALDTTDTARGPIDPLVVRIIETAIRLEGADGCPETSPFLTFLCDVLLRETADLTLSTIHSAKGSEFGHVILFQYNLLGTEAEPARRCETDQDRNLLYIAVTRAIESLTFLLTSSTCHIPSPFLSTHVIERTRDAEEAPDHAAAARIRTADDPAGVDSSPSAGAPRTTRTTYADGSAASPVTKT